MNRNIIRTFIAGSIILFLLYITGVSLFFLIALIALGLIFLVAAAWFTVLRRSYSTKRISREELILSIGTTIILITVTVLEVHDIIFSPPTNMRNLVQTHTTAAWKWNSRWDWLNVSEYQVTVVEDYLNKDKVVQGIDHIRIDSNSFRVSWLVPEKAYYIKVSACYCIWENICIVSNGSEFGPWKANKVETFEEIESGLDEIKKAVSNPPNIVTPEFEETIFYFVQAATIYHRRHYYDDTLRERIRNAVIELNFLLKDAGKIDNSYFPDSLREEFIKYIEETT